MAKRKPVLGCFLGWLKVLMKPLGCPGTEGRAPWHLLCPQSTLAVFAQSCHGQAVALSPPERSGCQHTQVSVGKQLSKTKPFPEKDSCWQQTAIAKAIHRLLGCLFQEQLRNGEEAAGQVTFARIQNPCIIRAGLWNVLPTHTPSQPSTWLGEVKPVKKPNWWSGTHTVTHRQLTLPQYKEDNKDDMSFWVTTASKLWVGCPTLMSLSLFLFTKQRSSSGETEAEMCWQITTKENHVLEGERKSLVLQIQLRLNCYKQHCDKSLSYLWQLRSRRVTGISANLLIWGMLEASHPQIHGEVWTGRDLGTFLLHPSAQSISNSETSISQQTEGSPRQIWWGRCQCFSRHPVWVHNQFHKAKFFFMSSWHFPCYNLWPIASCPFVPVDNTQETSTQWLRN